ncbi:Gp37-like protein [Streptomyces sp. URMC 123]|uniref:Gp37-like protein n=1 Tax=Streptomyces sp. URMC 123 TaxID=3423403 RepID=UPI003F1D1D65
MGYRVFVRDRPGQDGTMPILGEIDTWIKLDFTIRFNQPGAWQMLVKVGTTHEQLLKEGRGIVIYQDGLSSPIFSGPIEAFEKYWTVEQHTGEGSVYVGGKCDNHIPFNFLAFPSVTGEGTDAMKLRPISNQWEGIDRRPVGGPVGQALWVECDLTFGARALPDRKLPGVVVGANPRIGADLTDTLRYDNLGTKFTEWLKEKKFGYRFLYNPSSQKIELTVYACKDLGKTVRFAPELGNIKQYTWQLKAPTVTRAIVACQGEGKDRYIYQATDEAGEQQWGVLVEQFIDRRDVPLKTVKGNPELVTKTDSSTGFEDIGLNPEGKEWTPDLITKKALLAAAEAEVPAAEKAVADAKTDAEKKAAASRLASAKATLVAAQSAVKQAIEAAKPVAVEHYLKVVQQAAKAALKEGEKTGHFQVYPIDTPQCQFGRDYYVGDIVSVNADNQTITDAVKEVTITVDDGGRVNTVTPKVGDQGTGEPLNLYKQVFEMREKLRKLEARM